MKQYCLFEQKELYFQDRILCVSSNKELKGHRQLMHIRIRYHFLADLHVTRRA